MEISRRGGFTRNFEGKERTIIFSLSSGDTGLLHNESYILSVSFLSVTRDLLRRIRHVHPHPGV